MQDSVLTLGEKIVLAARLASIEHIRQELADYTAARSLQSSAVALKAESESLNDFVRRNWAEFFTAADAGQEPA